MRSCFQLASIVSLHCWYLGLTLALLIKMKFTYPVCLMLQHNFTDGMALGSAFLLHGSIGGWSRTLFLLAHELPQEVWLLSFADMNISFSTFEIWILCSEYIISICRRQGNHFFDISFSLCTHNTHCVVRSLRVSN